MSVKVDESGFCRTRGIGKSLVLADKTGDVNQVLDRNADEGHIAQCKNIIMVQFGHVLGLKPELPGQINLIEGLFSPKAEFFRRCLRHFNRLDQRSSELSFAELVNQE